MKANLQLRVPIKTSKQKCGTRIRVCHLESRLVMQHACLAGNRQATEQ